MKKRTNLRLLAAVCALVLCLGILPSTALFTGAAAVDQNVALGLGGRTGTSNSVPGLTDGIYNTIASDIPWNADVASSNCWAEIDLRQAYDISSVRLVSYADAGRYYHWEVYATNDNTLPIGSWTKIAEKSDNSVSTSNGYLAQVTTPMSARYVRIYGTYNSANIGFHFNEIEIYAPVSFETQQWTVGGVTAELDETGTLRFSGAGVIPDYASASETPWASFASIITNIDVGEGIIAIGDFALANCGQITRIKIPSTLTAIGSNAFSGVNAEEVEYPGESSAFVASLTESGEKNDGFWRAKWVNDAYSSTSGYLNERTSWSFSSGILTVSGTGALPSVDINDRPWNDLIPEIVEIKIGSGITSVSNSLFARMTAVDNVYIPDSVTALYNDAFAYCGSIDYIRMSSNITSVMQGVLYSTSVDTIACALTWEEFREGLSTFAVYNDNFERANWIKEDDPNRVFNLSKGKEVEVSAGSNGACITDGNKGGNYWDGGVAPAEITIDLGAGAIISSINVVTYYADGRYYHYEVYASADGRNYSLVAEKSNNDPAAAAGEDYVMAEPLYARYISVVLTYNSANASVHLHEVTVYGKWDPDYVEPEPPTSDIDDPLNIAFGKPTRSALGRQKSYKVTDGSVGTYWAGDYYPSYVDIDLLEEYDISEIIVYMPVRSGRYYYYTVYGSNDLSNFTRIYQKRSETPATNDGDRIVTNVTYRFIRVYVEYSSGAGAAYLSEVRVHGTPTGSNTDAIRTGSIDEILGITDFDDTEYASPITDAETIETVYGIIDRTVGSQYRSWFTFTLAPNDVNDNDYYVVSMKDGKVQITANTGVCLAAGLNYYYKYYCNVEISEQARQTKMPASIVPVTTPVRRETPYKIRYAFNYCTLDYSFAFFGEEDFIKENDWLALCGVNVVLDLAGQEAVWIKFLMNFGYTYDEAKDWIAGPSYYAWQFMDNMENFGGPVSDGWVYDRLEMARSTQRFKRALGIQTVLQGYAGMVPTNFSEYQDVTILKQGGWSGLARPDMIRTDGALYDEYAALFYDAERWAFGETSNYYAVDPFHEGGIRPSDLPDTTIAAEVLESLLGYDPDAVWMVQAWWSNPTNGLLQGMGEYRQDHVIILDLTADKWNTTTYGGTTLDSVEFDGTDWVWCLLKNYGGNPSMDGRLYNLATKIPEAYQNSEHMKGIGLISEATLDNPVVYQMLFDMAWETETLDINAWLDDYVVRRYGAESASAREAWSILRNYVYNRQGNSTQIMARVPDNIGKAYPSNNELQLEQALRLLLVDYDILSQSEGYLYDLSELMRQMVNNYALYAHNDLIDAFDSGDLEGFLEAKARFLNAFDVLDSVLSTEADLMAGNWIGRAEDWAAKYDDFSMDSLPMNAKVLITTWAGAATAASLPDYAYRHYEGMMIDVYKARWEIFLDKQEAFLRDGTEIVKYNQSFYFHYYWNWVMNTPTYERQPNNTPSYIIGVAYRVLNECSTEVNDVSNIGNVALGKDASAEIELNTPGSYGGYASYAVDGAADTYWDGGEYSGSPELIVDLKDIYDLTKLNVVNYADGSRYYQYEIYVSVDGVNYTKVAEKTDNTAATTAGDVFEISATARFIKLIGRYNSANDAFHLGELRAYGSVRPLEKGDVNGDRAVNIADVSALLTTLAGLGTVLEGDLNEDGVIGIEDVTYLLNLLKS